MRIPFRFDWAPRLLGLLVAAALLPSCHDGDGGGGGDGAPGVTVPPPPTPLPPSAPSANRNAVISGDGQLVAFESDDDDPASQDQNGVTDIFVFDRLTGRTTRVSEPFGGGGADGPSFNPSISADGRFVAFESQATNLVPPPPAPPPTTTVTPITPATPRAIVVMPLSFGDPITGLPVAVVDPNRARTLVNPTRQVVVPATVRAIFVRDLATSTTVLASASPFSVAVDGDSSNPSISQDGRLVAFETRATNLMPGLASSGTQIVLRNLVTGAVELISVAAGGGEADGDSTNPSISGDGRRVAFESTSTTLLPGGAVFGRNVFLRDRVTLETTLVSSVPGFPLQGMEMPANGDSRNPSLSGDGTRVAFETESTNLVAGPISTGSVQIILRDLERNLTQLVSVPAGRTGAATGHNRNPAISADGTRVAFESAGANLTLDPTPGGPDIFLHEISSDSTTLISTAAGTVIGSDGAGARPSLSANGLLVAFESTSTNLVPNLTTAGSNVFVHDVRARTTERIGPPPPTSP